MKLKKIISILVLNIFILSYVPVVCAESVSLITSIKDGDVIYNDVDELTFSVDAGYDVTVILDGDKVLSFVSEGNDTVTLPQSFEIGKHKLIGIAKYDSKVLTQEINFEVKFRGISSSDAIYIGESRLMSSRFSTTSNSGYNAKGELVKIGCNTFEGKDGTPNGAIGFYTSDAVADLSGAQEINISYEFKSPYLQGSLEIEYDIKIEGQMRFEFEIKNKSGSFGNFGTDNMISNGKIAGKKEYISGEWFHMKHVIDLENAKEDLYVNGEKILSGNTVKAAEDAFIVKIQTKAEVSEIASSVALDNFRFGYPYTASGVEELSYNSGDGYVAVTDGVITEATRALRLTASDAKPGSAAVKVYADGEEIEAVKANVDVNGNIDITLSESLPAQADVKLVATLSDYVLIKTFRSSVLDFGMADVAYATSDGKCYIASQLDAGAAIDVQTTLCNNTDTQKTGMVVVAVYNGTRLSGLKAKSVTVAPQTRADVWSITIDIPSKDCDYTVECYMFDSFAARNTLSKVWYLD